MVRRLFVSALVLLLAVPAMPQGGRFSRGSQAAAVAIPAGTQVQVRMIDSLSSETSKPGDTFRGTLATALVSGGHTLYPKGTEVTGRVFAAKPSGRLAGPGELRLALTSIGGQAVNAEPLFIGGESHTKSNVTKIGGGAAAGAVIGAITGGGKGAAIGSGVGAAAGTGVAAATGKKPAKVESEAVLQFVTAPLTNAAQQVAGQSYPPPQSPTRAPRNAAPAAQQVGTYNDDSLPYSDAPSFSDQDRRSIRSCFQGNTSGLPPGLAKRDRLPPGLERQVQRNGTLPPGLQKRVQPLPGVCESQLPRIPVDWRRVVLGQRVLLLDQGNRILDLFSMDEDEDQD